MLSIIVLSLDSILAGAALRLFGVSRRHWPLICTATGVADALSLIVGQALHLWMGAHIRAAEHGAIIACCALASIAVSSRLKRCPVTVILTVSFLFSIDNLLAGARMHELELAVPMASAATSFSAVACAAGLYSADVMARYVKPKASFALACLAAVLLFVAG